MRRNWLVSVLASVALLVACALPARSQAAEVPRMTKGELKAVLGTPGLVVIDVRTAPDWEAAKTKIAGAVREDPTGVDSWAKKYPKNKTIVLYCA